VTFTKKTIDSKTILDLKRRHETKVEATMAVG
jgi:hypothetical protein